MWIVFFIVGLLGLSKGTEYALLKYDESRWEAVLEKRCAEYLAAAEQAFGGVQRVTRRTATELAQYPVVHDFLTGAVSDRAALFEQVSKTSREQNVGIEVYDRHGILVAWEGRSGPMHQREVSGALAGQLTSYVSRLPIYAQLFVASPVRARGAIAGAILVRRTIELNYPFSNRFVRREGLTDQLTRELGVTVEFNFSEHAEPRKDGRYVSVPLYGIDSSKVGIVSVMKPARSAYFEGIGQTFHRVNVCLVAVLVALFMFLAGQWSSEMSSVLARSVVIIVLVWVARYVLLWLDVPSLFLSGGIFDPSLFASKFGGGLAKSVGDLTLTMLALLLNVILVAYLILKQVRPRAPWWYPRSATARWVAALVCVLFLPFLLRGYDATIRSAVFDSTLNYSDPRVIVPSYQLGLMIFNLFVLSFCLIVVAVGVMSFVVTLFRETGSARSRWLISGALYLVGAVLYSILHSNPLVSTLYLLLFGAGILAFAYHLHGVARRAQPVSSFTNFLTALALSALCFYPLLDESVQEKDRALAKVYASEVTRPVDSWLKFVVDEALQGFATEETRDVLLYGTPDAVERLAFTHWAQSSVNREGYACVFAVTDTSGAVLSKFAIGGQGVLSSQLNLVQRPGNAKTVRVTKVGEGVNALDVYSGSMPIVGGDEESLGYAVVLVAAGQQPLFRGTGPPILRNISQQDLESFYRPVTVSEFRDGVLRSSNAEVLPIGYRLPEEAQREFRDSLVTSFWMDESIDGTDYETLYLQQADGRNVVIAVSLQKFGVSWYLINIIKVVVYYFLIVLAVFLVFLCVRWVQGARYEFVFRDRLLVALLVTAIVPLAAMAWYGRIYAHRRFMDETAKRLKEETATVALNVVEPADAMSRASYPLLTEQMADQLATDLGTDFNLYRDDSLQVSTRPELYEAGILDRRLNGSVYASVILRGKRFYVETENIGLYQHAVGYRPLVARDGRVYGIVSVPTLYRQDQVDEEVSRQNAFVFGAYAIVLFVIVLIATTLANRIAAPIHSLTEATKRIARGDLDISVRMPQTDGEIGNLVKSFETMMRDLKENRKNLIRFERELAWKEMAKQVAHEIKNPLTPMKLSLQHLRQTYKDRVPNFDQVFEEVSKTIIEQIDTLGRIASEFSHFGRMPTPHLQPCDVNDVLKESVALFGPDPQTQFELSLADDLPVTTADKEELRRAFINIIRNGIQAMNNAGRMLIASQEEGHRIVITFRDFGVGITDEAKERLFQPNFSTKTDGMGLGLAIVKKTLDDLKATIMIERAKGGGTLVTIGIPLTA